MLDAENIIGLLVEDINKTIYEVTGFYMVLETPNYEVYVKLKDVNKKTFLNMSVSNLTTSLKTQKFKIK